VAKAELAHDIHLYTISVDLYETNTLWEYCPFVSWISGSVDEI